MFGIVIFFKRLTISFFIFTGLGIQRGEHLREDNFILFNTNDYYFCSQTLRCIDNHNK